MRVRKKDDVVVVGLAVTEIGHYHHCWHVLTDRLRSVIDDDLFIHLFIKEPTFNFIST